MRKDPKHCEEHCCTWNKHQKRCGGISKGWSVCLWDDAEWTAYLRKRLMEKDTKRVKK